MQPIHIADPLNRTIRIVNSTILTLFGRNAYFPATLIFFQVGIGGKFGVWTGLAIGASVDLVVLFIFRKEL